MTKGIRYINSENARILIDKYNISTRELMLMTGLRQATIENYISMKRKPQKLTKELISRGIILIIIYSRNTIPINRRLLSIDTYSTITERKSL